MIYQPLTDAQAKQAIDAEQTYVAWRDAWRASRCWAGGMHWKTVAGREYLYKTRDGMGNAKSLGLQSVETEKIESEFRSGKLAAQNRLHQLKTALQTQTRINAVLRLGSASSIMGDLCGALAKAGLFDKKLMVIGTNSLLA